MSRKKGFKVFLLIAGAFLLSFFPVFILRAQKTEQAEELEEKKVIESAEGKVTMDFKEADIKDVLRIISYKSGMNIVYGEDVRGKISIHLSDVSWERALDVILRTYGFGYEREGNVIRVCEISKLRQEEVRTRVFGLSYANAEEVSKSLEKMLSERGRLEYDKRTNLLIITDIPPVLDKVEKVIEKLDRVTPQVMIEAQIVEVSLGDEEKLGINWNAEITAYGAKRSLIWPFSPHSDNKYLEGDFPAPSGSDFQYGTIDFNQFQAIMQFLSSRTDTNILSSPKITTLNNQEAKITVGTKWPVAQYTYNEEQGKFHISGWEYIEYGILLTVTPTVNEDERITLRIRPEISDKAGTVTFDSAEIPILTTQEVETKVMVKDGDTLIIGGLLKDKKSKTKNKVPFLGDIPLLGHLFTHTIDSIEKKDLLIFITPHIVRNAENTNIHYLSQSSIEIEKYKRKEKKEKVK
ncbi:MAG: hypothetical protein DRP75_03625 [Candidatus Omnitrophota bacterium]|nr:MAG: hypothetical protein DRP75_03625 [Candidatus Omnitrophota bacterium]